MFGVSNKATVYQDIKDMLRNENMVSMNWLTFENLIGLFAYESGCSERTLFIQYFMKPNDVSVNNRLMGHSLRKISK